MEEGVEEQGEVGIGGCMHGGGVVEGGQGDHYACHIFACFFWKLELELLEDNFSSMSFSMLLKIMGQLDTALYNNGTV